MPSNFWLLKKATRPTPLLLFSQNLQIKTMRKPFSQKNQYANFALTIYVRRAKIKTCINPIILKVELRERVKLQRKERGVGDEKPLSYTE